MRGTTPGTTAGESLHILSSFERRTHAGGDRRRLAAGGRGTTTKEPFAFSSVLLQRRRRKTADGFGEPPSARKRFASPLSRPNGE